MLPLINPDNSCCFTGHRPSKLPWGENESDPACLALKARLFDVLSSLYASGIHHFICGMAAGCDMYFCEAAVALRDEHDDVTIEAAIPCEGQADRWAPEQRSRYFRLVALCDYTTLIGREYTDTCMEKRNRYMVDNASVVVAVYDGRQGGTASTIAYAAKKGREIIELRP